MQILLLLCFAALVAVLPAARPRLQYTNGEAPTDPRRWGVRNFRVQSFGISLPKYDSSMIEARREHVPVFSSCTRVRALLQVC